MDIYLHQIQLAQEFMNENSHADISRLHCLLRKLMPQEYHKLIDEIKENQSPTVFNVFGGMNTIAPNAKAVYQDSKGKETTGKEYIKEIDNHVKSVCKLTHTTTSNMDLKLQKFSDIDINEPFFDSLRESYPEFNSWYERKSKAGAEAYTYYIENKLKDFLYLKTEDEELSDTIPALPKRKRLKVGTFKVENESRHTTRGERFMKKIMDKAVAEDVDEIYVTMFPTKDLQKLIQMFETYGFKHTADKPHEGRDSEYVLVKDMRTTVGDIQKDYPFVEKKGNKYVLSIVPEYHTKLFPDSILKTETKYDIINDVSETNSIIKIYICWMKDTKKLVPGDKLVIYRTNDYKGPAAYRSVCTSVCTVAEVKVYGSFDDEDDFVKYTNRYSVFSEQDLRNWYKNKSNFIVIKMLYNIAFTKKVINKTMKERVGLDPKYWGFFRLSDQQFDRLLELGEINERYIVDKAGIRRKDILR